MPFFTEEAAGGFCIYNLYFLIQVFSNDVVFMLAVIYGTSVDNSFYVVNTE